MRPRFKLPLSWPLGLALLLFLTSQFFYLALSFSSLESFNRESSRVVESLLIEELAGRLENTAKVTGSDLRRLARVGDELVRTAKRSRTRCIVVADAEGRLVASRCPNRMLAIPTESGGAGRVFSFEKDGGHWLGRTLFGPAGEVMGGIYLAERTGDSVEQAWGFFKKNRLIMMLAAAGSTVLLILALKWGGPWLARGRLKRWQAYALFLVPFLIGQSAFYSVGLAEIDRLAQTRNQEVAQHLGQGLRLDLEKIVKMGVRLDMLSGLEPRLSGLKGSLPLISAVSLFDGQGRAVAAGDDSGSPPPAQEYRVTVELTSAGGQPGGWVEIWLSPQVTRQTRIRLILDNLTMTLVAGLLLAELARLILIKLRSRAGLRPGNGGLDRAEVMRPLVFIGLFAMDMSLSFIPLKMASLNPHWGGLPPELIYGLPVSAEMALTGLAVVSGGFLAGRLGGWRPLFIGGLFLASGGYLLSGLAQSAGAYIAARALAGLGYGSLNIASQLFVVSRTSPEERGRALGDLFAGFFSGGLCGCAAGGLMADRVGFGPVFGLAAAIFAVLGLLVGLFFPADRLGAAPVQSRRPLDWSALKRFLGRKAIMNLGLLNVLPAAVVLVGLVNYFLPLHLASLGAGPAVISQMNVLFSILVVVLGPLFGRALDQSSSPHLCLVLSGLLAAAAFFSFAIWSTLLTGAVLGLICLGLSRAVSENGQAAYLLRRPEVALVGDNQALGLHNAVIRVGQMLGPVIVAVMIGRFGTDGLYWLGAALIVMTLGFWRLSPSG